jgi:hypothetical protein
MHLELDCSSCGCQFTPSPKSAVALALQGLEEVGPWSALGDGETVEDLFYNTLTPSNETACPACGAFVLVTQARLGELTHSLLATW